MILWAGIRRDTAAHLIAWLLAEKQTDGWPLDIKIAVALSELTASTKKLFILTDNEAMAILTLMAEENKTTSLHASGLIQTVRQHRKERLVTYLDPIDVHTPDFGDLYDELPLWSAPFGLWILDRAPIRPGLTILDIGSGTGFISIELAERCGPEATVIAVDPWRPAMERLRRKLKQRRLTNVRLLEQDAEKIDLPDGWVDVIVSNLGVNNFDDPAAVLQLCSRIAKPGASFLLTTNLVGHMAEFSEVYRKVLLQTGQGDRIPALEADINHRATTDSVSELLERANFEISEVVTSSFRLRFADESALLRHFFIRLGFVQAWSRVATTGRVQETFEVLESELNTLAAARGELVLTIPMACILARKPVSASGGAKGAAEALGQGFIA